ncbi:hypothetical protein OF83DRAFT_612054 [Amylostereum chailletii]|nr:hypothetical protein OF83DRAFT_612054 [Amylostereum chailletii]
MSRYTERFLSLPPELILKTLQCLDCKALLVCRETCRRLRDLIDSSRALEYTITLVACGASDVSANVLPTSDRLDRLRRYHRAWQDLEWVTNEPGLGGVAAAGYLWELYTGVWAKSSGEKGTSGLSFVRLPSEIRGIDRHEWAHEFGFPLLDFGLDVTLDLLVLIEDLPLGPNLCRIHIRSLSTGDVHPSAPTSGHIPYDLHVVPAERPLWSFTVRINGDFLGIFFISIDGASELCVWNWKTGERKMLLYGDEMRSFTFLSENLVLVATMSDPLGLNPSASSSLVVYNVNHGYPSKVYVDYIDLVPCECSFALPPRRSNEHTWNIRFHSDPSPGWKPADTQTAPPFCVEPDQRLLVVDYEVERERGDIYCFSFFIPMATLLANINAVDLGLSVPWTQWGATTSCVVGDHGHWDAWGGGGFVYGMRYICPQPVLRADSPPMISVWDFHPVRVRRALAGGVPLGSEHLVVPPVDQARQWYPDGMKLPFIVKEVPVPEEFREAHDLDFMISEDTIVVQHTIEAGTTNTHFLSF